VREGRKEGRRKNRKKRGVLKMGILVSIYEHLNGGFLGLAWAYGVRSILVYIGTHTLDVGCDATFCFGR
jgi:hypothetical protein